MLRRGDARPGEAARPSETAAPGDSTGLPRTLFEDVLSRRRLILGDDHPDTVGVRKALDDMDTSPAR
jgi:hypothetical protein